MSDGGFGKRRHSLTCDENPARRGDRRTLSNVLVDTGAELSWVPASVLESLGIERDKRLRFRQASG